MAKKLRGYTGTQRDDYTGTPGKRSNKVKPKPRPTGAKMSNIRRKAAAKKK